MMIISIRLRSPFHRRSLRPYSKLSQPVVIELAPHPVSPERAAQFMDELLRG